MHCAAMQSRAKQKHPGQQQLPCMGLPCAHILANSIMSYVICKNSLLRCIHDPPRSRELSLVPPYLFNAFFHELYRLILCQVSMPQPIQH